MENLARMTELDGYIGELRKVLYVAQVGPPLNPQGDAVMALAMWLHRQKVAALNVLETVPKLTPSADDEKELERERRLEAFRFQVNQIRLAAEGAVPSMSPDQRAEAIVRMAREALDLKPGETLEALKPLE